MISFKGCSKYIYGSSVPTDIELILSLIPFNADNVNSPNWNGQGNCINSAEHSISTHYMVLFITKNTACIT